jgi:PAS domain S-box-containing protein
MDVVQRHSGEVLETIFDHSPVMISFWDASGRVLYVNRVWEETLGWTLEEARDGKFLEFLYPDPADLAIAREFIERCDRRWADFRVRTRHGKMIDMSWARFRLSDHSSIGFGLDITERKNAERALAESEARFAKVFQASPVALAVSNLEDGRILDVNDRWVEIFGYERDEAIGRTNADLNLSVHPPRSETVNRLRAASGALRNIEVQVRQRSGDVRDLMVSAVPLVLNGVETWLSAQLDITDWKRAEAERDRLLESEKKARADAEAALERVRAMESITDTALRNLGLDALLQELLTRVKHAVNADFASVSLVDEKRQELVPRSMVGRTVPTIRDVRAPLGHGVAGRVAKDGRPRVERDLADIDLSAVRGASAAAILAVTRSMIAAPLKVGNKIIGVVTAASSQPDHFDDETLKLLLMVADRVAPAIERANLLDTIRAGRSRLKALSGRLLTAQEEERRRLAFELHDELGQVLTAVKINLQSFQQKADSAGVLRDAIASVDQAMERIRGLALDLRPSMLDDLGLPAALRAYTDGFARDTGIEMRFSADAAIRLDPELETACFRVAQEALTNVLRHARARHVTVDLHVGAGGAELRISDDGEGFDVAAARERAVSGVSLGLLGMEERVSHFEGELEVRSAPGKGTQIAARFRSPSLRYDY